MYNICIYISYTQSQPENPEIKILQSFYLDVGAARGRVACPGHVWPNALPPLGRCISIWLSYTQGQTKKPEM